MEYRQQLVVLSWLGVSGIGSQTLARMHYFFRQHSLSWLDSWSTLSTLLASRILSKKQYENALFFLQQKISLTELDAQLRAAKIKLITHDESHAYSRLLASIDSPPFLLTVQGNSSLLGSEHSKPVVAVVGTRQMTPYGKLATVRIVDDLVAADTIIVSGGMYGIDAAAHAAALSAGGKTVAVLASGLLAVGSEWQKVLGSQIRAGGGALVSEYYPWQSSQKSYFPVRNRIVAGLSQAVIVVEAADRSGSLITAQLALDAGREVGAVPGPITSQFSQGTKWLINQGATLVTSGADVLVELHTTQSEFKKSSLSAEYRPENKEFALLYELLLKSGSLTTSQLAVELKMPHDTVVLKLSQLELQGSIVSEANRWYLSS